MKLRLKPDLLNEFPKFEGSTGGWLSAAKYEEKYVIIWKSKEASIFELPTGGAAKMNAGSNVAYFARKEQCLALGKQLRTFNIRNYKIFRICPPLEITLLHPFDGVFPEKVNKGRVAVGYQSGIIGMSPEELAFSKSRKPDKLLPDKNPN